MAILDSNRSRRQLTSVQAIIAGVICIALLAGIASFTAQAQPPPTLPFEVLAVPTIADEHGVQEVLMKFYRAVERKDWAVARECIVSDSAMPLIAAAEENKFVLTGRPHFKMEIPRDLNVLDWSLEPDRESIVIEGDSAEVVQTLVINIAGGEDDSRYQITASNFGMTLQRIDGTWLIAGVSGVAEFQIATDVDTLRGHGRHNR